jgi:hypothetical protein
MAAMVAHMDACTCNGTNALRADLKQSLRISLAVDAGYDPDDPCQGGS